jgi:hypothetical protein
LVASVDATVQRTRATAPVVLWVGLATLGLVCAAVGYLAGAASLRLSSPGWLALAFLAFAAVLLATILLAIAVAAVGAVNGMPFATLQEWVGAALADRRAGCTVAPIAAWITLALGAVAGADRPSSDS